MATVNEKFFSASWVGGVATVLSLLRDNPRLDVNWADKNRWTALHVSSWSGHAEVVKALLAHSDIAVNARNNFRQTPFLLGCLYGRVSVVQVLLKDPRVDITLGDSDGCTPLWHASYHGQLEVVQWLIASGRELGDLDNSKGKDWCGKDYTALEIARELGRTEVASLLERFMADPAQVRHEVCARLGVLAELAAGVFALTVFLCDNFLQPKPAMTSTPSPAASASDALRFFAIVSKLPMELQMVLSHRVVCSAKQNILSKDSEVAFKALTRILQV